MAARHPLVYLRVRPFTFTQASLAEWPVAPRHAHCRTVLCTACGRRVLLWGGTRIIFPPVCNRAAGGTALARRAGGARLDGLAA